MSDQIHDTYAVNKIENETEKLWILEIFGAYAGANFSQKRLERQLTVARSGGYKFILSRVYEPNMLWQHVPEPEQCVFIFDVIHEACENTGFDPTKFKFLSGNAAVNRCYDGWCLANNITDKIKVVYCDFWITTVLGLDHDYGDLNCNDYRENVQRPYSFSCFNRRYRKQKGDTLAWLYHNNVHELYGDQIITSFVFDDLNLTDEGHEFVANYGEILKQFPSSLEAPDADRQNSDMWNKTYPELMTSAYEKAVMDSYCDIVIDYVQSEDFTQEQFDKFKKLYPWWQEMFISEKVYKTMAAKKPFLLFNEKGALEFMRKTYGFRTYDEVLFDETYDIFDDYDERLDRMLEECWNMLKNFDPAYMHESVYSGDVQSVIRHNYDRVYELAKKYHNMLERNLKVF